MKKLDEEKTAKIKDCLIKLKEDVLAESLAFSVRPAEKEDPWYSDQPDEEAVHITQDGKNMIAVPHYYIEHIYLLHGVVDEIIQNRDKRLRRWFNSRIEESGHKWDGVECNRCGVKKYNFDATLKCEHSNE